MAGGGLLFTTTDAPSPVVLPAIELTASVCTVDVAPCLSSNSQLSNDIGVSPAVAAAPAPDPIGTWLAGLLGNGTADHPNAGLLIGNGFRFDGTTCTGGTACNGGNAGAWFGNGGNGFSGGNGGNGGAIGNGGNGGNGVVTVNNGKGGNGGNAGQIGNGGKGGAGAVDTTGALSDLPEAVAVTAVPGAAEVRPAATAERAVPAVRCIPRSRPP